MGVRLHLGCGLIHRPGWINLDRYATEAADLLADAPLLPFVDGCAEAVEALQLVEHLGYVGTLYGLHEWARVLEPGGTLLIETPDRPATLRAALDGETGEEAQPWLFGTEQRGQGHRYLFAADELAQMASKAGFALANFHPVRSAFVTSAQCPAKSNRRPSPCARLPSAGILQKK